VPSYWGLRCGFRAVITMDKPRPKRLGRRRQYKPETVAAVFSTAGQTMRWVRRQVMTLPVRHPDSDACAARGWGNAYAEFFAARDSLWDYGCYSLTFLTSWGHFTVVIYQVSVLPIRDRACKCPEDEKEPPHPLWDQVRILREHRIREGLE
jgi:hypothetical protein